MESPKFQVGQAVQTINSVATHARCSGVIKYRFYGIKFDGWLYVIQPNYAVGKEEGIVYAERILELSPPVKVVHCCCCPNEPNRKAYPLSFHKGQRVRTIKNGVVYFGKINCVIDMKTYYDYYVDVHAYVATDHDSTIRCNEKELCSCCCCCCHCHYACC